MTDQTDKLPKPPEKINFSRKFFVHGDILLLTARTEEGLPFPPNPLINYFTTGILARAQELYPVRICHFVFLANHFHIMIKVINPDDVPRFVGYLKCEMAHTINRLLGRRRKTVFSREYDSPKFLTPEDVKKYIKYIYLNPAKANLETSIDKFPGINSWNAFNRGNCSISAKKISRSEIKPLSSPSLSISESSKLAEHYRKNAKGAACKLNITPNAWSDSFDCCNSEKMNEEIIDEVSREEKSLAEARKLDKKRVVGSTSLKRASLDREYKPKKFGKRMTVICSDLRLRIDYLSYFKDLCVEAQQTYKKWKRGLTGLSMPPGMFAPSIPSLVWAIPPDY